MSLGNRCLERADTSWEFCIFALMELYWQRLVLTSLGGGCSVSLKA